MHGKRPGKKPLIAVGIAAAICAGVALLYYWYLPLFREAILPGFSSVRATSTAIADVTLRDPERGDELHLKVPQAYMVRAGNRRGGVLESVRLETRLPDLAAVPASPTVDGDPASPEYERSLAQFNNGIALHLDNAYVDSNWALGRPRQNWLTTFSADKDSGDPIAYELVDDDYSGLLFYKQLSCGAAQSDANVAAAQRECRDAYREHYLSKDETRPTVHIGCEVWDLPTLTYRLGCTAETTYRGFRLTYVFRHSQLSRWVEFDSGVRRLLDGFVTENSAQ